MSVQDRFWAKVDRSGDCWLWTGARLASGYGELSIGHNGMAYAHRLSWEIANGPIPEGRFVLHRCDNPPCVNPAHLFLGTHADNMADMAAKGRNPRGSRHANSRLTEQAVRQIRSGLRFGFDAPSLAEMYGVSNAAIHKIRKGQTWRHVA